MKTILCLGIAVLLGVIQGMLFHRWFDSSLFAPNIMLLSILASVVVFGFERSLIWIVFSGIVYDIAFSDRFVMATGIFLVFAFGMSLVLRQASIFNKTTMIVSVIYVIAMTVLFHLLLVISEFGWKSDFLYFFHFSRDGWNIFWNGVIFLNIVIVLRMFSSFVFLKKSYDTLLQ